MNIYDYQRPLGKMDDISELRDAFIAEYDARSKKDMVCFGLLLGNHILGITGFVPCEEIHATFAAMQRWLDGQANYHESRSIDCDTAVCGKTRGLQATWLKSASSEQCIRLPASRIASTTLYGRRILR